MSLLRTFYIFTAIWLVLLIHNQSNYGNCYDLHCLAAAFWGVTLRSVILTAVVYFCATNLSSQRRKRDERYHSDEDSDGFPEDESLGCVNETNTASLNTDTPGVNSLSGSSRKQPTGSDNNHLRNVTTLFDENLCWNCSKENFRSALESCGKCGSLKCHECSACSRSCIETCDQVDMSTLHKKRVKNHLSKQPSVILSVRKMRMCADEISLIFRKEDQLRVFDEELGWGKVTAVEARFHGEALYHIEYDAEGPEVALLVVVIQKHLRSNIVSSTDHVVKLLAFLDHV